MDVNPEPGDPVEERGGGDGDDGEEVSDGDENKNEVGHTIVRSEYDPMKCVLDIQDYDYLHQVSLCKYFLC